MQKCRAHSDVAGCATRFLVGGNVTRNPLGVVQDVCLHLNLVARALGDNCCGGCCGRSSRPQRQAATKRIAGIVRGGTNTALRIVVENDYTVTRRRKRNGTFLELKVLVGG